MADTAAEKKPGKKARHAAKGLRAPAPKPGALRSLRIFEGAAPSLVDALEKAADGVVLERDTLYLGADVETPAEPALHFVVAGQVGVGQGARDETVAASKKKTKAETFKAVGKTLAVFGAGDFFSDDVAARGSGLMVYAITEAQVVRVPVSVATVELGKHPRMAEKLRAQAERWVARVQQLKEGGRDDVFDFYVKNGFSFSTRTKIRQLELCIDCDKCVQGCEDRHGFSRLERFGPQVGLINFSVSCRQCYDPRCLIDCNFDAIRRDPVSQEIRISMEACTGCNVCARNCPNDSIFIYDIPPDFDTAVWERAGRKVPKKTATKCDRCAGYDDMACITACPTGSMIDAVPELLFGLAETRVQEDACAVEPFEHGFSTQEGGRRFARAAYAVAAVLTTLCVLEWLFRRWMPALSFMPFYAEDLQRDGGIASGRGLGLAFGVTGFSCMLGTLVYSLRNRVEAFSFLGSKYVWFSFHNALGVLGPSLVLLHGNLDFSKWPSVAVYMMLLTVVSGFCGQYLANQIPGKEFAIDRELKDLDRSIAALSSKWSEHTRSVNVLDAVLREEAERTPREAKMGSVRFLFFLLASDLRLQVRMWKLRFGGMRAIRNRALRRDTMALLRNRLVLERRQRFFGTASRLLARWKTFHVAFCVALFAIAAVHVGVALAY